MKFWNNIHRLLETDDQIMLLYVFEHEGSSPGKQGFKMAITKNGEMLGSIGGGVMEQKLVELAKNHLSSSDSFLPFIKKQIHSKDADESQSGMICSGEQTVGFYKLDHRDLDTIKMICDNDDKTVVFSEKGIKVSSTVNLDLMTFEIFGDSNWLYKESVEKKSVVHIIGAGHVGLALSEVLNFLGFYVKIFDDRNNLYTLNQNTYADEKHIVDFHDFGAIIPSHIDHYVVLVSFGYRTDKIALKQLIHHDFKYIGMMGSEAKIEQLYKELINEGISKLALEKLYAPIGITKHNSSPEEIAVSIATQLVQIKNS